MKKIVVGILAHVDAGKTTLSEGLLYTSGMISKPGRVDKRDAYLDTHKIERERGITVFSKQAILDLGDTVITLIDTPGHVDFSCEAERALTVQDYAILLISATDGITAHTRTLWNLLSARGIPTFIFVNKTDISDKTRVELLKELSEGLSPLCVDFMKADTPEFFEAVAAGDESAISEFFETDSLSDDTVATLIRKRRVYPCIFGSALKMTSVDTLLSTVKRYTRQPQYSDTLFGAKVYKISRDTAGKRLTFMKITGATLENKDTVTYRDSFGGKITEKIEEIRVYSGDKYKSRPFAEAGSVVAVLGPTATKAGTGMGTEYSDDSTLEPPLSYRLILPKGSDAHLTYLKLAPLAEEDPTLGLNYDPVSREIRVRLMGEIQAEILKTILKERFEIDADFDEGNILYKETVADSVLGAGHFEPLRHYAEVHLLIEPLPEGSGIITASECESDTLATNWQRLVLTHLEEKRHKGVLTGSPLTDVKITLVAGRAHIKHTEGGDFRQATYRAVRQGLMKAESVLLEPTFDFRIEVPQAYLGRVMTDITNMHGTLGDPVLDENFAIIEGTCPVYTMRSYPSALRAATSGEGKIHMTPGAYMPCHNRDEVIQSKAYDPELDERNPAGSVFCKGGAGYSVPWHEADEKMHTGPAKWVLGSGEDEDSELDEAITAEVRQKVKKRDYASVKCEDEELIRIFERTYGKIKPRHVAEKTENAAKSVKQETRRPKKQIPSETYILVDGYNLIFAWGELKALSDKDMSLARDTLVRILCDYAAFRKCRIIAVFDAYARKGDGSVEECGGVTVVYTKEAQTADSYIEKATKSFSQSANNTVRVVTSDMQEQFIILGNGGLRVSAIEFKREVEQNAREIKEAIDSYSR